MPITEKSIANHLGEAFSIDDPLHQLSAVITERLPLAEISDDQWPVIADAALTNGLGPMLFQTLKSSGHEGAFSHNACGMAEAAHQAAAFDILYEESMGSITRALGSAGIPAIWLKGAVLARTVYPQASLRPMVDLDVLVPREQIEPALGVLKNLGYRFTSMHIFRPDNKDSVDENYLKHLARHHYVLIGGGADSVSLELHFGLPAHSKDRLLKVEQMAWLWEQTRPFSLTDGTICTGLSPLAHLLYLAAHNIFQHGESQACLMRDLDVHLLIIKEKPDWEKIINRAVALGWTGAVYRTLERAVDYFETPVPKAVFDELIRRRPSHEDSLLPLKKQEPGYRWDCTRETLSSLSIQERIVYIFQNLFPAGNYMRRRYAVPRSRSTWPYYPFRWFDQTREIVRAMMHQTYHRARVKKL